MAASVAVQKPREWDMWRGNAALHSAGLRRGSGKPRKDGKSVTQAILSKGGERVILTGGIVGRGEGTAGEIMWEGVWECAY